MMRAITSAVRGGCAGRGARAARRAPAPLWAALAMLLAPVLAWAGEDYERWYTVEMGGQRAGHMHASQKTADGLVTTTSRMVMEVGRGRAAVSMTMEGQFVETADGKPVSMRTVQQLGSMPKLTEYRFGEKELTVTTVEGESRTEKTRALPEGDWLTPAATNALVRRRLGEGADTIEVRTMDPMSGPDPSVVTMSGIERTTTEVMGKTLPAIRCTATTSKSPGVALTEYLDEGGVPLRSQVSLGIISITIVAADRETALAARGDAPELMVRTFIKPDRPIRRPREARRASYLLSVPEGEFPELPSAGVQRVEAAGAQSVRVTVGGDAIEADPEEAGRPEFTASSSMLRTEDPEIVALVKEATRDARGAAARAEAMRAFVGRYITTKDLDVGFASASEVARTRRGDCSEHGALLAAMLRADGIPARVVSGLVYVDQVEGSRGVFGYHMWAQALLERGEQRVWVDLDATLPERAFDATHIALAVSALTDGEETTALGAILPLMGRLQVKVESIE